MMRVERGVLAPCVVSWALACSDGAEANVTFTDDIHPIFVAKCGTAGCHDQPGFILPGHGSEDVDVAYQSVIGTGSLGMPIYDRILVRIAATTPGLSMPPPNAFPPCEGGIGRPGCISQAEYDLIKEWVDQGHPK